MRQLLLNRPPFFATSPRLSKFACLSPSLISNPFRPGGISMRLLVAALFGCLRSCFSSPASGEQTFPYQNLRGRRRRVRPQRTGPELLSDRQAQTRGRGRSLSPRSGRLVRHSARRRQLHLGLQPLPEADRRQPGRDYRRRRPGAGRQPVQRHPRRGSSATAKRRGGRDSRIRRRKVRPGPRTLG